MKKYFFTGLVTLLPLAVTIWVVHFFVNFLTKPFLGFVSLFTNYFSLGPSQLIRSLSQIVILIALFILIFIVGLVGRRLVFNKILKIGDRILIKIPLVNKVYTTSKDIVKAFLGSKEKSFRQVVLLQFPYQGAYCIGLIVKEAPKTCSDAGKEEMLSIFIPTTPNPSTGYLVMSSKKDLIFLDMKTDEAIKYVVSCGVIQPERPPE